jgi:hypothetical protein
MAGCDSGEAQIQPADSPPMHLVEVLVTTGLDATGAPVRTRVASDASTRGVLTTSSIALRFDRFIDPISATRQAICLQPTLRPAHSYRDCSGTDFLQPAYDPVWREVVFHQAEGARLSAQTTYQLTVFTAPNDQSLGFAAFDGAPLDGDTTFELTTLAEDPPGAKDELPVKGDRFCGDAACLGGCKDVACAAACPPGAAAVLSGCAHAGCHSSSTDDRGVALGPAMGLDLSSPDGIAGTALAHVAHEAQTGEHAARAETRPQRFGRAMPIVDPGNPGNSYLLYKQLVGDDYAASPASPGRDEIARLRNTVVVGMPMPAPPGRWVGLQGLEQTTAWISLGAEVSTCAPP